MVTVNPNFNFYYLVICCLALLISCDDKRESSVEVEALNFSKSENNGFVLPDDWQIDLWAESPDLYNPTNMDIDSKGRIWVTEAVNYRDFNNKPENHLNFEKGDRVVILEDTDGDGVSDSSKVFVQDKDLVAPMGIAVIGNKVVVSCAPNLFVYTDEDGDDKPDKKEVFLTGFGGYDHDHSLHSLVAGPDGKWYFNAGNAGPHNVTDKAGWQLRSGSVYTGGTPYNKENQPAQVSDDGRIWVGGLALRIGSDGKGLEVVGHNFRNAYELAVDSYGNMWQNDNDDGVETCRSSWLMEGGNIGFFNADGSRTWQADHRPGQDIFSAHWHQLDPGVIPAGDQTGAGSPTGVAVYEGDAFGSKYNGMLMTVDAGRNVIFAYQPAPTGAGFGLDRRDLVTSMTESTEGYIWHEVDGNKNKWFRPSDVTVGTDGAIYIADWYDPVVGGHRMMDSIGYGRIYRVSPKGKTLKTPKIDLSSTEGQIAALLNPAVNVRNLGFEALLQQGGKVVQQVRTLLKDPNPYHQARAIWLLSQLSKRGENHVENILLREPNPRLRVTAYRALKNIEGSLIKYAATAADDPSPAVRREVAISLRDADWEAIEEIVKVLFKGYDGKDRWYVEALGLAVEGKEEQAYTALLPEQSTDPTEWTESFASFVWRIHPKSSVTALKERALSTSLSDSLKILSVDAIAFIKEKEAVEAMLELANSNSDKKISKLASWWLSFRKNNDWYALWDWESFHTETGMTIPEEIAKLQEKLLDNEVSEAEQIKAGKALTKSEIGGRILLGLASDEQLSGEIIAGVSEDIFNNPNQEIRTLASEYFIKPGGQKISSSNVVKLKGDPEKGKEQFNTQCATCHKIGDTGNDIGPKLATIGEKFDKTALVDAILNPSAAIAFGYEPVLIKTKQGQTVYGFLLSEGVTTVIKDIAGDQHVILRRNIESKEKMQTSMMPDANTLGLSEQDLANITSYLLSLN